MKQAYNVGVERTFGIRQAAGPQMANGNDVREFLLVLRRALLIVVRWIERRYGLSEKEE